LLPLFVDLCDIFTGVNIILQTEQIRNKLSQESQFIIQLVEDFFIDSQLGLVDEDTSVVLTGVDYADSVVFNNLGEFPALVRSQVGNGV
jgi:hypothetical protein